MEKVVSAAVMRESDAYTVKNVTDAKTLMLRAGKGIFESFDFFGKVAVVCGEGNNAGDGYVLALLLNEKSIDVTVFLVGERFSADGRYYFEKCVERGIKYEKCDDETDFSKFDIIADCIFGTGFHGETSPAISRIIDKINGSGKFVVSADINSGLDSDSGLFSKCVRSSLTVSVGTYKYGHFLGSAKDVIKTKKNIDIGIDICGDFALLVEKDDVLPLLSHRKNNSNKGNYGYVGIMGGCTEYSGAVKLSNLALSALRAGAGVSRLIIPESITESVSPYILESTLMPLCDRDGHIVFDREKIDAALFHLASLAVGMGWGESEENAKILSYILENYSIPLLIDADGINTLSKLDKEILKYTKCSVVLTPHPKEFERLCGVPVKEILSSPVGYAKRFAEEYGVILLLKGASTVICGKDGTYIVDRGCPGMASAGSGDVLSGILAGMLGYTECSALAVACGAYIAGIAGEMAQKEYTDIAMTSSDTVKMIPKAVKYIRGEE